MRTFLVRPRHPCLAVVRLHIPPSPMPPLLPFATDNPLPPVRRCRRACSDQCGLLQLLLRFDESWGLLVWAVTPGGSPPPGPSCVLSSTASFLPARCSRLPCHQAYRPRPVCAYPFRLGRIHTSLGLTMQMPRNLRICTFLSGRSSSVGLLPSAPCTYAIGGRVCPYDHRPWAWLVAVIADYKRIIVPVGAGYVMCKLSYCCHYALLLD